MIYECQEFPPVGLKKFNDKILCLSGTQDKILDIKYNDEFCRNNNIKNIYLNVSHSLYNEISKAFEYTLNFFNEK